MLHFFFHFLYVTWEGSTAGIEFVLKRFAMVIIPLFFELSFSQSKIYFFIKSYRLLLYICISRFLFCSHHWGDILSQLYSYTRESLVFLSEHDYEQNQVRKKQQRKIIWFNPPFNLDVSTNAAKTFLNLIEKHFPRSSKLHKIFNKNTVKVSYSCTQNMSQIIKGHNKDCSERNTRNSRV